MDIAPTGIRYQNYHKMIKAIEKCSLQAMFGPEITSTRELLPKASAVSPVVTLKASIDNVNDSLSASSNRVPSLSDEIHISADPLLIDPTNEDGNIPSEPTTNDGGLAVISTNEEGNVPTEESVNGGDIDPISAREDGMTTLQQSEILGRIPMETWGQKVGYHGCTSSSSRSTNALPLIRSKNFANGPAREESFAIFMTYLTRTTSIQTTTVSGTQRTFFASAAPSIPWRNVKVVRGAAVSGLHAKR